MLMYDEVPGQGRSAPVRLELVSERLSARELIESRVRREVDAIHREPAREFRSLVPPTDAQRTLNGFRLTAPRALGTGEPFAQHAASVQIGLIIASDLRSADYNVGRLSFRNLPSVTSTEPICANPTRHSCPCRTMVQHYSPGTG